MATSHLTAHYSLKHRATATVSRWFDGFTYTVRHGLLTGMKRKGGLGFLPAVITGKQETAETRFLAKLDLDRAVVYDIGGFQGLLTLFFSTRAREVVVYEPNPASRSRLEENLRLNSVTNVRVRPVGCGVMASRATLVYDPLMPGAATADASIGGQIRDTERRSETTEITIVSVDDDRRVQHLPDPTFVKIDVEGLELQVLQGMADTLRDLRPALYIEMHGATRAEKLANAKAVVDLLDHTNYALTHIETGNTVTPDTSDRAEQGHLFGLPR